MSLTLRAADETDFHFLAEMLVAAAFWRPDGPSGSVAEVLGQPQLSHYVDNWPRHDDVGIVALDDQQHIGAAWLRVLPASDPGYGFVDASIPELAMAVTAEWRGRGVGSQLLSALTTAAREHGFPAVSLSVERENPAKLLYERHGFKAVSEDAGALTMLLELTAPEAQFN